MIKRTIFASITSLVFAGGIFAVVARAETPLLTAEQQTIISQNCVASQTVLQRIQHNDAASRINRGQIYETLFSRLMTPLNTRATSNGYNNSAAVLVDTTKLYQLDLERFKNHYKDYDNAIAAALRVKCKNKPAEFYSYIEKARVERQNLSSDVGNLARLIEQYKNNVFKLRSEVQ